MNLNPTRPGILVGLVLASGLSQVLAADPVVALDFGTTDSPVAEGFGRVTRATAYDCARGYGWTKPPRDEFDCPLAYPLDPLSRDGVAFSTTHPIELRVDLPNGDYVVEAVMGVRSPTEYRPDMFVTANGTKLLSGLMGNAGWPTPARFETSVTNGVLLIGFGCRRDTPCSGAINWLVARASSRPMLQLRRAEARKLRPAVRWLAKEKMRMAYGVGEQYKYDLEKKYYVNTSTQLWANVCGLGFNAVATRYDGEAARYFRKRHVRLFHVINLAVGEPYTFADAEHGFIKNVFADGREDVKPSPLDRRAWQELVVKEALRAHRQAQAEKLPLAGVLVDLEMYGAKVAEVYNNNCTFDAVTYDEFARLHPELGSAATVPPGKRQATLSERHLLNTYYVFMEQKMEAIARDVEHQIHAEAPDLLLGFLQYFDNWFYRGFIRGLGTASMPVLAFTENTYWGYNYNAAFEYAWLRSEGMHAFYYPGFWPKIFHPDNLGRVAYAAGVEADGFWLFGYHQTSPSIAPAMDAALKLANQKLSRTLTSGRVDRNHAVMDHEKLTLVDTDQTETALATPDPDPHETKLQPLPSFEGAARKFDLGHPRSPVREGWTRVLTTDLFDAAKGFGWERAPYHSLDRSDFSKDALLCDGIVVRGRNQFLVRVPAGRYEVSVILGDLSPTESRTHQNLRVNGQPFATDVTTNGGEYRLFTGAFDSGDLLRIESQGRGAQQYVSVLAIVVRAVQ